MNLLLWLAIAMAGGIAAILGTLMAIGSLLLMLVPTSKMTPSTDAPLSPWRGRLQVFLVAVLLSLSGLGILAVVPFPNYSPI